MLVVQGDQPREAACRQTPSQPPHRGLDASGAPSDPSCTICQRLTACRTTPVPSPVTPRYCPVPPVVLVWPEMSNVPSGCRGGGTGARRFEGAMLGIADPLGREVGGHLLAPDRRADRVDPAAATTAAADVGDPRLELLDSVHLLAITSRVHHTDRIRSGADIRKAV